MKRGCRSCLNATNKKLTLHYTLTLQLTRIHSNVMIMDLPVGVLSIIPASLCLFSTHVAACASLIGVSCHYSWVQPRRAQDTVLKLQKELSLSFDSWEQNLNNQLNTIASGKADISARSIPLMRLKCYKLKHLTTCGEL